MFADAGMAVSGSDIAGSAQGSAYVRDKRHSRHTGTACCDSPAVRGTARWGGAPEVQAPADRSQIPCRIYGRDTADRPAAAH